MKPKIVMSFDQNGTVQYTRDSRLHGIFKGEGEMQRITEIRKLTHRPRYYIEWLEGPFKEKKQTNYLHFLVFGVPYLKSEPGDAVLEFETYEAAVEYEINCVNTMRQLNVSF